MIIDHDKIALAISAHGREVVLLQRTPKNMARGLRGFLLASSEEVKSLEHETERQKVSSRLKPKELTDEQKQRLEKLKEAKQRRHGSLGISTRLLGRSMSTKLYSNDRGTKFLIASAFCSALAIILYPKFISRHLIDALDAHIKHDWLIILLLDLGSIFHLCACAFVHFGLVNVAFVYAFNALEISKKAGKESRKYYNEKATEMAAIISISITAFAIGKALISVLMRILLWNALLATGWATKTFSGTCMAGIMSTSFEILTSIFHYVFLLLSSVFWVFEMVLVKSNSFGQFLEWVIKAIISLCPSLLLRWNAYAEHVVAVYEESTTVPTWRSDAIDTVRLLMAYSTVFLFTILLLFNLFSRGDKLKVEMQLRSYGVI